MSSKHIGMVLLIVTFTAGLLGCALTERMGVGRGTRPVPVAQKQATRTPWPTFTATPPATPTPLPTATPTETLVPTPTDTPVPTDTPQPTETPKPKPKPKATKAPEPPTEAAPAETPTPEYQFRPEGWEGQWNAGLSQIRGRIRDKAKQPVNGYYVQAKCGGTILASNPSGVNMYAPNESYTPGAYDLILSSPLDPNSMCNWEVRVVKASTFEEAKDPNAPALSPVGYCDLTWDEMSICFANWRQNY
jgi:hypothetical protein